MQAEDGIRDPIWSRGLGDVYKNQEKYGEFDQSVFNFGTKEHE